jgi:hypothetical protein
MLIAEEAAKVVANLNTLITESNNMDSKSN